MHEKGSVTRGLRGPLVVRGVYVLYTPPPYNAEELHLSALCQQSFAGIAVHDGSSFQNWL